MNHPLRVSRTSLFALLAIVFPTVFALAQAPANGGRKPNVVVIVADDLGWTAVVPEYGERVRLD